MYCVLIVHYELNLKTIVSVLFKVLAQISHPR